MTAGRDNPTDRPRGRIAGLDFGTVRIGIAIGDAEVGIAGPYENYTRGTIDDDARRFRQLADEEAITRFVVGLPVHVDGNESAKSLEARQFAKWLTETTGTPVVLFDERYTSAEAEQHLTAAGMTNKQRKARRDMLAAQIILASYLESPQAASHPPQSLDD